MPALEQLLIQNNLITQEQLDQANVERKKTGERLGNVLVKLGFVQEHDVLNYLSQALNIPLFDLKNFEVKPEITHRLPESYARQFHAIILEEKPDQALLIGIVDPTDIVAVDELRRILQSPVELALVSEQDLLTTLDLAYRRTEQISTFAEQLDEELGERIDLEAMAAEQGEVDATVLKMLQSLFEDAAQTNASDIHIEPEETFLRIRIRVDGILHEQIVKEKTVAAALALRLKLMSGLNITEKRLPQEGRFNAKVRGRVIDVRISILPSQFGESVVMRLLDKSRNMLDLEQIGMQENMLPRFYDLLKKPHGLILVTGPTGSGKTTTLYGVLNHLNVPEKKIVTVEDPVEYRLERITQAQVRPKLGLNFSNILTVMMRQDPDIIMVGEIRDEETASIGMRAALTGHLVFSTLHTNDAASSALRLLDMGVQGYLVASTLRGVLAQRLVRRVCESCRDKYELDVNEQSWIKSTFGEKFQGTDFHVGKGCAYCNNTGYKGRIGIFEFLELDHAMAEDLLRHEPDKFAEHASLKLKGKLLLDNGMALAAKGITTISEVIRVAGESY